LISIGGIQSYNICRLLLPSLGCCLMDCSSACSRYQRSSDPPGDCGTLGMLVSDAGNRTLCDLRLTTGRMLSAPCSSRLDARAQMNVILPCSVRRNGCPLWIGRLITWLLVPEPLHVRFTRWRWRLCIAIGKLYGVAAIPT